MVKKSSIKKLSTYICMYIHDILHPNTYTYKRLISSHLRLFAQTDVTLTIRMRSLSTEIPLIARTDLSQRQCAVFFFSILSTY